MPIKSQRDDFEENPSKVDRARSFCFEEGWTGIGWGIAGMDDNVAEASRYEAILRNASSSELGFDVGYALSAHNALANRMKPGDFAWCRERGDIYWLGRVRGPWTYRNTGRFDEFDLYQTRQCQWQRVGPADLVPGPVKNAFAGRGSAISQLQGEAEAALRESATIWRKLTSETVDGVPMHDGTFSLSSLGHDDLEDLVALYLQSDHGWYVVPSTAKRSTPYTECVLRNAAGQRAYFQVKSGHSRIGHPIVVPPEVDRFFLFDAGQDGGAKLPDRVERIDPAALMRFAAAHPALLPLYLQQLLKR